MGLLNSAGMAAGEDLFATVPRRFAGRWRWLFVNLIAAFIISRVVGFFEPSIAQLAALAVLMPIVASMSGNNRQSNGDHDRSILGLGADKHR